MAKESVKIFSENIDTATKSIKSLRNELKQLKDAMTNTEEGSEEFYKLADKAGAIQHQITEITETVRGASADFGIMLSNSMQSINGIVGGLQAVTGALAIFGIQNEDLLKTITKLQGLLSIGSGISQIDNAIKAVDRLRVSITGVSNAAKIARAALQPKVLLVVTAAIAALSAIIGKWKRQEEEIERQAEATAKALRDKQIKAIEDYTTALKENFALQEKIFGIQTGGDDVKTLTKQLNYLNAKKKILSDENASLVEEQRQLVLTTPEWQQNTEEWQKRYDDLNAQIAQNIASLKTYNDEISNTDKKLKEAIVLSDAEIIKKMNDLTQEAQEAGAAIWEEMMNREPTKVKVEIEPEVEEIDYDGIAEDIESYFESKRIKLDYSLAIGDIDEAGYLQALISLEQTYIQTIQKGTDEWYKQSIIIANLQTQLNDVNSQQTENTAGVKDYLQVASAGFAALGSIFSNLASLQDTTTQEGIDKQANYQYAAVVMNTANAIISSWTSAMALPAPASFILGGIQTAAAGILGAIQIAQVKKAAKEAGANLSGGSSSASTSSSAISSIAAPVQYTSEVDKGYISKAIGDTQMYVSVTEIDRVSNRVNVAENESKY